MARGIRSAAVHLGWVLSTEGSTAVGATSTVGVDDDFAAGEARVSMRTTDDKFSSGIHVQFVVALEQGLDPLRTIGEHTRQHDVGHILLDAGEHGGLIRIEIIMLGRQHHSFYPQGRVVIRILDGDLALAVRSEVGHLVTFAAEFGQHAQHPVTEVQRKRHEIVGFPTGIAEHHALVSRPLLFRSSAFHPLIDVGTLLVNGTEDAATRGVKHVLAFGVPDPLDGVPGNLLHIQVRVALHLTGQNHLPRRDQRLARDLGLGIKGQEMVNQRIRNLVCDLVRVAFTDGLGRKEVGHIGSFWVINALLRDAKMLTLSRLSRKTEGSA